MTPFHNFSDPNQPHSSPPDPDLAKSGGVPSEPADLSKLGLDGGHWQDMIATLPAESTARLGDWVEEDLAALEAELSQFVTSHSLKKSLRR